MVIDVKNSKKDQKCITSQKYYGPCLRKNRIEKRIEQKHKNRKKGVLDA